MYPQKPPEGSAADFRPGEDGEAEKYPEDEDEKQSVQERPGLEMGRTKPPDTQGLVQPTL